MKQKLYPFSVQKHAHDIEYRRNFVFCRMADSNTGVISEIHFNDLHKLHQDLTSLLLAVKDSRDGKVAYLTGKQIGLAKETVAWAANARSRINSN